MKVSVIASLLSTTALAASSSFNFVVRSQDGINGTIYDGRFLNVGPSADGSQHQRLVLTKTEPKSSGFSVGKDTTLEYQNGYAAHLDEGAHDTFDPFTLTNKDQEKTKGFGVQGNLLTLSNDVHFHACPGDKDVELRKWPVTAYGKRANKRWCHVIKLEKKDAKNAASN